MDWNTTANHPINENEEKKNERANTEFYAYTHFDFHWIPIHNFYDADFFSVDSSVCCWLFFSLHSRCSCYYSLSISNNKFPRHEQQQTIFHLLIHVYSPAYNTQKIEGIHIIDNWWLKPSRTNVAHTCPNAALIAAKRTLRESTRFKSSQAQQRYDLRSLLNQPRWTSNKLSSFSLLLVVI